MQRNNRKLRQRQQRTDSNSAPSYGLRNGLSVFTQILKSIVVIIFVISIYTIKKVTSFLPVNRRITSANPINENETIDSNSSETKPINEEILLQEFKEHLKTFDQIRRPSITAAKKRLDGKKIISSAYDLENHPLIIALTNNDLKAFNFVLQKLLFKDEDEKWNVLMNCTHHILNLSGMYQKLKNANQVPKNVRPYKPDSFLDSMAKSLHTSVRNLLNETLHNAIIYDTSDVFERIHNHINFQTGYVLIPKSGESFLHVAIEWNRSHFVRMLLQKDHPWDVVNKIGVTPLMAAIRKESYGCFEVIINRHPNILIQDHSGDNIMHYLARCEDKTFVQKCLIILERDQKPSLELCIEMPNNENKRPWDLIIPTDDATIRLKTILAPKVKSPEVTTPIKKKKQQGSQNNKTQQTSNSMNDKAFQSDGKLELQDFDDNDRFFCERLVKPEMNLKKYQRRVNKITLASKQFENKSMDDVIRISWDDWGLPDDYRFHEKMQIVEKAFAYALHDNNRFISKQDGMYIAGSSIITALLSLENRYKSSDIDILLVGVDLDKIIQNVSEHEEYKFHIGNGKTSISLCAFEKKPIDIICIKSDEFESNMKGRDFTVVSILIDLTRHQIVGTVRAFKDLLNLKVRAVGDAASNFKQFPNQAIRGLGLFANFRPFGGAFDKETINALRSTPVQPCNDFMIAISRRKHVQKLLMNNGLTGATEYLIKSDWLAKIKVNKPCHEELINAFVFPQKVLKGKFCELERKHYTKYLMPLVDSLKSFVLVKNYDLQNWFEKNRSMIDCLFEQIENKNLQPVTLRFAYRFVATLLLLDPEKTLDRIQHRTLPSTGNARN